MRIVWNSDIAEQIIRRMNDADQGMMDCLRDASCAAQALTEANQDGESETLNRLAERLEELTQRMRAAQQRLDDLIEGTRRANDSFEEAEHRIGAMFESAETGSKPDDSAQRRLASYIKPAVLMADLRPLNSRVTPEWLSRLASDPKNFLI